MKVRLEAPKKGFRLGNFRCWVAQEFRAFGILGEEND